MKISGAVIQTRNIKVSSDKEFIAEYKGYSIYISANHGFGEAKYNHLTRFNVDVKGKDGLYAVQTYEDCHTIEDAIRVALKGACLIA